ncbi:MAG TPA: hypothetical protein VIG99_17150, partial [Myxococcaceae bacterium]
GTRPEMVELLRRHVAQEKENQRGLGMAQQAIADGNCESAERMLIATRETLSFHDDWARTSGQVEKCRQEAVIRRAGATTPTARAKMGESEKLFEDGKLLLKKRQYKESLPFFQKCLDVDKDNAECHLALGSVHARLREPDKGAAHYREFLRLAPDHERAPEIRRLLEDFEAQKK